MPTEAEHELHKRCPDCAEQVLAAARKCRYCGYRFDTGRGARSVGTLAALIPGLVRPTRRSTMPELLADWNVALQPEETVRVFSLAVADGRPGYLLVTGGRVIFFAQRGRRDHEMYFAYATSAIRGATRRGPRWRRRLILWGPERDHEVCGLGAALARRLDAQLGGRGVHRLGAHGREPPD